MPEVTHEIGDALHKLVERGRDYAEHISPVGGGGDRHAGQFRDSWSVEDVEPTREGHPPGAQLQNA